ncbi:MAG: hypothetical protein V4582_13885 [Pseudomonadota bacterium]
MSNSYHLYLTSSQAFLRTRSGMPWSRTIAQLGEWRWDASAPASLQLPIAKSPARRRPQLHVYAGSGLCKFMTLALPSGLRDHDERTALVQAQMQRQLGINGSDWEFTFDTGPAEVNTIACALRRPVLERIHELSTEYGLRLMSVKPFVAGVWNAFRNRHASPPEAESVLIAIEDDAYTVLVARSTTLKAMSTLSHRGEHGLVEREVKRLGLSAGANAHDIRLAISQSVTSLAKDRATMILQKRDYLQLALYPDFRDLLFTGD